MAKLLCILLSVCSFIITTCQKHKLVAETIIKNVTVLNVEDGTLKKPQDVVIRGRNIAFIGKSKPHKKSTIIDGRGKFLMPGLTEMHAHIPTPETESKTYLEDVLFLYLSQGVTTIRGMLGDPFHLQLKEDIKKGEILSPRIYTSSPSLNGGTITSKTEAIDKVRQYKLDGYDFLKIHPGITLSTWEALESTAKEVNIPFAGHVPIEVGIHRALESGYATIDHLDGYVEGLVPTKKNIDPEGGGFFAYNFTDDIDIALIEGLVEKTKRLGVSVVPTQTLFTRWFSPTDPNENLQEPEMKYMPSKIRFSWRQNKERMISNEDYNVEKWQRFIAVRNLVLQEMDKQDVTFLLGSDAPQVMNVPGFSLHHEMEAMAKAGISTTKIIQSGTLNPATFFGADGNYGTIQEGASADLILLNNDPFVNIKHARDIAGVMVRGEWLSKTIIAERLKEIAEQNK